MGAVRVGPADGFQSRQLGRQGWVGGDAAKAVGLVQVLPAPVSGCVRGVAPGPGPRGRTQPVLDIVHQVLSPEVGVRDLQDTEGGGQSSEASVGYTDLKAVDNGEKYFQYSLVHRLGDTLGINQS